ncbi:MAG TPA: glycosyltransferase family 2 protein [Acidobacteriaceae bacterium]|nr:glycosyltransferase family 2 protein [Acidobacteriaceae bacterium]
MQNAEFTITVGMPVCNAMPWLPEAMESLLSQTAGGFSIVAIVDGGSDGSAAYLRSLRVPQLHLIEQPHAGVTATLNRLLREVRTPWLVRMDADDVSYPTRIATLLEAVAQFPEAGLIYSLADYHPRERCAGQFRCSRGTAEELRSIVESGYLLSICHSTVALNVEKARAIGGYRMDLHAEDADLWWRMARNYEIRCIPEALVGFRLGEQSVSSRHLESQQLAAIYVQYLLLSDLWGLPPQPLGEVAQVLGGFVNPASVRAKDWLRRCNMHLARREPFRGVAALGRSICASPYYVARRVRDEMRRSAIANGVAPQLFWERKDALWA